jgi:hypothetical protein
MPPEQLGRAKEAINPIYPEYTPAKSNLTYDPRFWNKERTHDYLRVIRNEILDKMRAVRIYEKIFKKARGAWKA